jgi:hypothetical protein
VTPSEDEAIAELKGWYGCRFDLLVRTFRAERYMPYSEFQLYLSRDGVRGFPAFTLYRYIFPDAVSITKTLKLGNVTRIIPIEKRNGEEGHV